MYLRKEKNIYWCPIKKGDKRNKKGDEDETKSGN